MGQSSAFDALDNEIVLQVEEHSVCDMYDPYWKITVPFRPGVQSLVTINFELNTTYVLSRVTGHIEQYTKEIAKICQKYLLQ